MKFAIKAIGTFLIISALYGCQGRAPSFKYYMRHPEKIQSKIKKCRSLSIDDRSQDKGCIAAIQASRSIGSLLRLLEADPQAFGAKIMSFQIDYVNTKEKIEKLKKTATSATKKTQLNQLEKHLADVKYKINVYRGVIGLIGG